MSTYYLAPSLVSFRDEINKLFPKRDKTSDGWIGDPSHAARPSDHNPDWSDGGVVRAIDIDIDDNDPTRDMRRMILEAAIGDPRVWYVISNGIIYSRTHGWVALRYTGTNPHDHHVHISILHTKAAETNRAKWIEPIKVRTKPKTVSLSSVRSEFKEYLDGGAMGPNFNVRRLQRALDIKPADGIVGPKTIEAWAKFESRGTGLGRNKVPDKVSLQRMSKGRFTVVA